MQLVTHRRTPAPRRVAVVGALLGLLLVAGCGPLGSDEAAEPAGPAGSAAAASERVRTPAGPAPAAEGQADAGAPDRGDATAVGADVPVRSARLADVVAPGTVPPVSLTVAALEIAVPVDPVGVQPDGQMEIPPLAERAGWYRFGSSPADPDGTTVIAAHVDSVASAGLGPFARLPEAAVGDGVDVTLADGSVRQYAVTAVDRRPKPEIVWSEVFVRDGGARLVLVTCGGTFQRDTARYSDNVIVTAEPVGPQQPTGAAPATGGG